MTPEQYWTEVEMLQSRRRQVEAGIEELWELMAISSPSEHDEIYAVLREKFLKQGRILKQLRYMQDNISNPDL